jgi:RNA polymerase sigma-70 factor (ECF subfamily)
VDRKKELALIAAAQRGNSEAFTELYKDNVDHVYRYVYYRVHSELIAEDLTSDVFVQVLEGLATYRDMSVPFLSWIYRIAHGRVIDYFRKAHFRENQENIDDMELGTEPDMDSSLIDNYTTEHINAAIHDLNPEQREVIVLRFIEGYNLEKTAELLSKSVGAIKSLQFRAVQTMLKVLDSQGFSWDELQR